MKTGRNTFRNFFVKEPKFSVLIALVAIIVLVMLFLNVDFSTISPFTDQQIKMEYPSLNIPLQQFFSLF
jgi:hypothetical protein